MKNILRLFVILCCLSAAVHPLHAQWAQSSSGLTGYGLLIESLTPSGAGIVAGTNYAGLYMSANNGANWTKAPVANDIMMCCAVSGSTIIAGAPKGKYFRSSDNGATWTQPLMFTPLPPLSDKDIRGLAFLGTNLFAGLYGGGIYRSPDNGTTWISAGAVNTTQLTSLVVSGSNLFAGAWNGVFLSTNNGASWTAVNAGLTNVNVWNLVVSGTNLYAATWSGGVFLSTNNGASWSAINSGLPNTTIRSLAVSGGVLFAGTTSGEVFFSTNNGASWATTILKLAVDIRALAVSGGYLFAGTYGNGVWRRAAWEMTTAPGMPKPTYPLDKEVEVPIPSTFTWNPVDGTDSYHVQVLVNTKQGYAAVLDTGGITATSFTFKGLLGKTTYVWSVRAINPAGSGRWSTAQGFTTAVAPPAPPVLISPTYSIHSVSTSPTLTWNQSSGAVSYRVEVSTNLITPTPFFDKSGLTSTTLALTGLANDQTYYWHVNATGAGGTSEWSESHGFRVVDLPPTQFAPANGATGVDIAPTFSWITTTQGPRYRLQISATNSFTSIVADRSEIPSNAYLTSFKADTLPGSTVYYWRVGPMSLYGPSQWSQTRSFTTMSSVPAKVVLVSPLNQSKIGSDSVRFVWHASSPSVMSYEVSLIGDSTVTRNLTDTTITLKIPAGKTEKSFTWSVRAKNVTGIGASSDTWSFLKLTTPVSQSEASPKSFATITNYPNPFNPSTSFVFTLPSRSFMTLKVYNALGNEVAVVLSEEMDAGEHVRQWSAEVLPSGMYFYRMHAGAFSETKKILLLR